MTTDEAINCIKFLFGLKIPFIDSEGQRETMNEALTKAIETLKCEQWIPCDEFLPLTSATYLVTLHQWSDDKETLPEDSTIVTRMRFLIDKGWMVPTHSPEWINKLMHEDVLAWKYMPEPYKENKK